MLILRALPGLETPALPVHRYYAKGNVHEQKQAHKVHGQLIAAGVVEKVRERNGNIYGHNIYKITHEAEVIEYQQIAALYNLICLSFPKLTKLSDKRKKLISGEV